ncbi:MAG: EF-hand domain-containing protein [Myxococcaceae bacterium]|nr:EF-hand domain-containing protein [Myxococcaceae bacterium]
MFSENDPYQEVREIFGHYDRNKSGVIDASEFARLCEALGMEMDDEVLQAGLSVVDADGDGKISWDEFLAWWRAQQ